jgi:hypothetical protein
MATKGPDRPNPPKPGPGGGGGGGTGGGGGGGGGTGGGGGGGGTTPPPTGGTGGGNSEKVTAILDRLKAEYPGFWESLTDQQQSRITKSAADAAAAGQGYFVVRAQVWTFPSWTGWHAANPGVGAAPEGLPADEEPVVDPFIEEPPPEESISFPTATGPDIRQILVQFLHDNDLPDTLMGFVNDALAQGMGATEIVARLRETPEYKAAYPENDLRKANGFAWMPESQIRAMRDEIRRLTGEISHTTLTQQEIANIIAKDKSLSEWEGQLKDYETFKRWGPTVQTVLQQELGYMIPDDRAFALISAEMSTPELDQAYERALLRAQPAVLGLGIRPEDEAELLRRYGISPEQAFKGYQGIVGELPAATRFAAIENNITQNAASFPTGNDLFNDTPFATLFRAIQLGDQSAIRTLQEQMARETARFSATGGAVRSGTELVGLLPGGQERV